MATSPVPYAARLTVDYPEQLDRLTTLLRVIWIIPILIIYTFITATGNETVIRETGERVTRTTGGGIAGGLWIATMLMIVFRTRYPRWWFDFGRELTRFGARIGAYLTLLTDRYPSTVEEQSVHLEIDYPEVERLGRYLPLVKWLLAFPHYIVLIFLWLVAFFVVIVAWFVILISGHYPRSLFEFVVGVGRWSLRVQAYAFLLVTDQYPPFSLS